MLENRICPYCGTENKGLDLKEPEGFYVCSNCKMKINSQTGEGEPEKENDDK